MMSETAREETQKMDGMSAATSVREQELALSESEARFRSTFENAAVGIAHVATDGTWLRVNRRVCDIVGYTHDELLQLTFQDITHPEDLDTDLHLLQETIEGKRDNYQIDKRYFRKDGSTVWVNLTVGCVRDEAGEVEYFISVIQDISEQKRMLRALAESEARFRAVQQTAPDAFMMFSCLRDESGAIVDFVCEYANPAAAQQAQTPQEEFSGRKLTEIAVAQGVEARMQIYREVVETGQPARDEVEAVYPDGERKWFRYTAVRMNDGVALSFVDVTSRKEAEARLRESEVRFRNFQQTTPDGFMLFHAVRNAEGKIEDFRCDYGNPASARLLLMDPEKIPGHRMLEVKPSNRDIGLFDIYCDVVETGRMVQSEIEYPLNDGSAGWFRFSVLKVDDGFAVSFSDITDRRLAEMRLAESESRFRAVQQTSPEGFVMCRAERDGAGQIVDFVCVFANPAASALSGRPNQDFIGRTVQQHASRKHRNEMFDLYKEVVETGQVRQGEVSMDVASGERWLRYSIVKVEDGFAVSFSDITDRKVAELKLRESEARFRAVQQTSPDGFMVYRSVRDAAGKIVDFIVEYVNPAVQKFIQNPDLDLVGMKMHAWMPDRVPVEIFERYVEVVETGKPWQGESIYPLRKGTFWLRATAAKVGDGFAVSFADITDAKRSEVLLRESDERLRSILNNVVAFVALLTPEGTLLETNDLSLEIIGLQPSDVIGKPFWEGAWWSHDSDLQDRLRHSIARAAKGERIREDLVIRTAGDNRMVVDFMLAPMFDEAGLVTHIVQSAIDISERKKAEQHREMLVRELSHRVKNSLATVQTIASHTLRDAQDLDSFREAFIGRLMAISKCHDLLVDATRRDADISQLIRDQVLPYAGSSASQVRMSGPPLLLGAEASHTFGLVLHELATNAAKYGALSTEDGQLDISWKRATDRGKLEAIVEWKETGGPPVSPPTRRGFGSVLIEQSLVYSLGGEARIEYRPEGLWARFRFKKRDRP